MLRSEDGVHTTASPPDVREARGRGAIKLRKRQPAKRSVTWSRALPRGRAIGCVPAIDLKVLQAVKVASVVYGVDWLDVMANARSAVRSRSGIIELKVVHAMACYLANTCGGVEVATIAQMMGAKKRTVQLRIESIEDRRDDPTFDRFLTAAEAFYDTI